MIAAVVHESEVLRRGIASCLLDEAGIVVAGMTDAGPLRVDANVAVVSLHAMTHGKFTCPLVVCTDGGRPPAPPTTPQVAAVVSWPSLTSVQLAAAVRAAALGFHLSLAELEDAVDDIDPRQIEVLRLLAAGATTRAISEALFYSERTVKTIIRDLEADLRAATRAQAVAEALRRGLI